MNDILNKNILDALEIAFDCEVINENKRRAYN